MKKYMIIINGTATFYIYNDIFDAASQIHEFEKMIPYAGLKYDIMEVEA